MAGKILSQQVAAVNELSPTELLDLYHQMVLIRRFEEKSAELYTAGLIGGFLHLYIGEEAIAVGACKALGKEDHLLTPYRDHGWAIARGLDPKRVMAELLGKATGVSGGKGGSMHLASAEHRYWGGHAIVGGHMPLATGVALAIQYLGEDDAVLCVLGEGSTNIGYFHESINLAAVWKLPVVYLVENNLYGMGTAISRVSAVSNVFERGCAYGIANNQVNGQDVLAVYRAVREALDHARHEGPYLLEALTYRYAGHSMGDPERYRQKAEIEQWRARDPILLFEKELQSRGIATEEEFTQIRQTVENELIEIVRFAQESPEPDDTALCEHVYVNPIPHQ
ncbi:MAG: pyruvate dehydrogenase (acetyl-transferring) E1 component subunit alpha [Anaerolineae bacterium]|nr:pyruvate dehydrogenase (acetyl-transferring) E1 component subunit alpha [Anaerolineae bacterium]MDW8098807.1 pyruvate dehydrogenase (acetyl-transferring) E1 component subunit alpha [Anaerolineae bacterium]